MVVATQNAVRVLSLPSHTPDKGAQLFLPTVAAATQLPQALRGTLPLQKYHATLPHALPGWPASFGHWSTAHAPNLRNSLSRPVACLGPGPCGRGATV